MNADIIREKSITNTFGAVDTNTLARFERLAKIIGPFRLDPDNPSGGKAVRNRQCMARHQSPATHLAEEMRQLPSLTT